MVAAVVLHSVDLMSASHSVSECHHLAPAEDDVGLGGI